MVIHIARTQSVQEQERRKECERKKHARFTYRRKQNDVDDDDYNEYHKDKKWKHKKMEKKMKNEQINRKNELFMLNAKCVQL